MGNSLGDCCSQQMTNNEENQLIDNPNLFFMYPLNSSKNIKNPYDNDDTRGRLLLDSPISQKVSKTKLISR